MLVFRPPSKAAGGQLERAAGLIPAVGDAPAYRRDQPGGSLRLGGSFRAAGFTLVEMLVVLAIIAILVVMTASATLQVLGSQRVSNSELTVKKAYAALQRQWDKAVELAKSEPIPDAIYYGTYNGPPTPVTPFSQWGLLQMASAFQGDPQAPRRARVIWVKLRLKQQFPNNFFEALYPTPDLVKGLPTWAPGGSVAVPWVLMPPEPMFSKALTGNSSPTWWAVGPGPSTPLFSGAALSHIPKSYEGGVCLLLALSRARSGIATIQDNLASNETTDTPFGKTLVDAWGMPLVFYRFAYGEDPTGLTPTNVPPTTPLPTALPQGEIAKLDPNAAKQFLFTTHDPLDPEGLLMVPAWNNTGNFTGMQGVWAFEKLCHPVHTGIPGNPANPYTMRSFYSTPVIMSAGKARHPNFGTFPPTAAVAPPAGLTGDDVYTMTGVVPPFEQNPKVFVGFPTATSPPLYGLVPDPMNLLSPLMAYTDPSGATHQFQDDNILSFRLRLGARGD